MQNEVLRLGVGENSPFELVEGVSIYYNKGYTIVVALPKLTIGEIIAFRKNELSMNLCKVDSQVSFFYIDVLGFYNADIAFTILKTGSTVEDMYVGNGEYCNVFNFVLVESTTNKVAALRCIGSSQEFAKAIYDVCVEQTKYGLDDYDRNAVNIQRKYSTEDLVNNFSICKYVSRK